MDDDITHVSSPSIVTTTRTLSLGRSPAQKRYLRVMRILACVYFVFAIFAFFMPGQVIRLINLLPSFGVLEAIPDSENLFWLVQGCTLLLTLSALSLTASFYPKNRGYPLIHIFSKLISIAGFLYLYVNDHRYFAYAFAIGLETIFALAIAVTFLETAIRKSWNEESSMGVPRRSEPGSGSISTI